MPTVDHPHLSQIMTSWSLVFQACRGPGEEVRSRQAELLERYGAAIYRYAVRALGDEDRAAELCQEFALRFVRGDFHRADPTRGRFRDYVKTAVIHLLGESRRQDRVRDRVHPLLDGAATAPPDPAQIEIDEAEFVKAWRKELLNRAWHEMETRQSVDGPPYHAALRLKADQPGLTAPDLAGQLAATGRGSYTAAGVRQLLHRARETFAALLLEEVARSLTTDDPDELALELADLDLLTYCREALARRQG
jgi:DNA-directed RNA polymerase specialized sigma24 family protein